jgi:hypothetical protein
MKSLILVGVAMISLLPVLAYADIYKGIDGSGRITYSNYGNGKYESCRTNPNSKDDTYKFICSFVPESGKEFKKAFSEDLSGTERQGWKKLDLEPLPSTHSSKKQQEQIRIKEERDAKDILHLKQESGQAKLNAVVDCKGEKSCKKAFSLTQVYINQYSDMKLQVVTENVIDTYNPIESGQLAINATKVPGNGEGEKISLVVLCKQLHPAQLHSSQLYFEKLCLLREADVYRKFRPFVEKSLH